VRFDQKIDWPLGVSRTGGTTIGHRTKMCIPIGLG